MKFSPSSLAGAFIIEPERIDDERGFFLRTFSAADFANWGLNSRIVQCSLSHNRKKGTLRGIHFQNAPHQEAKVVRCIAGAIYDVIVDLRTDSPTRLHWFACELTTDNLKALYIPEGFAHGFQTLTPDAVVYYQISEAYEPKAAAGIRWDDPAVGVTWPESPTAISRRDSEFPLLNEGETWPKP